MAAPPYRDPAYRAARAALHRRPAVCWRCGAQATTIDHVPPLGTHPHRRGAGCCRLEPACVRCNLGAGARIAASRRARAGATRRASRAW